MKAKNIFSTIVISALTALGVIFGYSKIHQDNNNPNFQSQYTIPSNYKYAGFFNQDGSPSAAPVDFTQAAAAAIPTVVHITTKTNPRQANNNLPNQKIRCQICLEMIFLTSFLETVAVINKEVFQGKWHQAQAL